MNKKVKIGNGLQQILLTDKNYLVSGGEADIYKNGDKIYKIYHDKSKTLPLKKIQELSLIKNNHVIIPQEIIYDIPNGNPIGYTTDFIDNTEPLLKLFTRTFKQNNNIDVRMINELVKELQSIINDIHSSDCLVVDFNELNVLVKIESLIKSYFIDVDSYQTPNFKSTAVMDSIRDRKCSKTVNGQLRYNPNIYSDWFSWGIISFYLYTNCHPYRGSHPNYKPNEKLKQFDDGVSVFHKNCRMPPCSNDFNVIPKNHLNWFIDVFRDGNRSIPPFPDGTIPQQIPKQIVITKSNKDLEVIEKDSYGSDVIDITEILGVKYILTKKSIITSSIELKEIDKLSSKNLISSSPDGTVILTSIKGESVIFKELTKDIEIGTVSGRHAFVRNNHVYTCGNNGKLIENSFINFGNNVIHKVFEIENLSVLSTKMYEGCLIQNLLGKYHLTIPYEKGSCFSKYIPQLDGHRIIDCKSDKWITVVIAEKSGKFHRFVICFNKDYSSFDVRKVEDIPSNSVINFAVLESNRMCILLNEENDVELFVNNQNIQILKEAPFTSDMKLFTNSDGIFFVNGNTVNQLKKK